MSRPAAKVTEYILFFGEAASEGKKKKRVQIYIAEKKNSAAVAVAAFQSVN